MNTKAHVILPTITRFEWHRAHAIFSNYIIAQNNNSGYIIALSNNYLIKYLKLLLELIKVNRPQDFI